MPSEDHDARRARRAATPETGPRRDADPDAPADVDPDASGQRGTAHVVIVVHVVRTGGFAGVTREWTAEPPPAETPRWAGLIDECPWDAPSSAGSPRGADRFAWRISARRADEPPRRAELSDAELRGPWRELVDEVRSFAVPSARPGR